MKTGPRPSIEDAARAGLRAMCGGPFACERCETCQYPFWQTLSRVLAARPLEQADARESMVQARRSRLSLLGGNPWQIESMFET